MTIDRSVTPSESCVPPPLDDERAAVRARLGAADALLTCFDFDGTLAPIVDDPAAAALRPDLGTRLRHLADCPDVTVAVVSGRAVEDLRDRVGIDGIVYAGNHGLEWDDGTGRTVVSEAAASRPAVGAAVERLRDELDDVGGCEVENKGLTATVHFRGTPEERTRTVVETVEFVAAEIGGLHVTAGKEIREVRPAVEWGKDRIVDRLRRGRADAVPLFVGDDHTDEDGFRAVDDDGLGVLVGDRPSAANIRVPDPDGVASLLDLVLETVALTADDRAADGTRDRPD